MKNFRFGPQHYVMVIGLILLAYIFSSSNVSSNASRSVYVKYDTILDCNDNVKSCDTVVWVWVRETVIKNHKYER